MLLHNDRKIYCDFSGYSDIAIGVAKLFGFNIMQNFASPYFSRDIAEFWRRWHISLSTWFRDYVYIPLGGSKGSVIFKIRNILIVFLVSGFWHGANWTFICWGLINALYFLPLILLSKNRDNIDIIAKGKLFPTLTETFKMVTTFMLVVLAWVFFRSENIFASLEYISGIFSHSLFSFPEIMPYGVISLLLLFVSIEWLGREYKYPFTIIEKAPKIMRWLSYFIIVILILFFPGKQQQFIYFQF